MYSAPWAWAASEAPELTAAADLVVVPSLDEAFGLVVAEAMATGKPVLGVCSGSIPEVMVDGETGFLVPALSPDALARCLVTLARDDALRERMGAARRKRAEQRFDPARVEAECSAI